MVNSMLIILSLPTISNTSSSKGTFVPANFSLNHLPASSFRMASSVKRCNAAFAVCGAVHGGIMNDDHMTIGGEFYVKFDAVGAFLQGLLKGRAGYFPARGQGHRDARK